MKPLLVNDFQLELNEWCANRFATIPDYGLPFFQQGGWEGWLQVELAMFLTAKGYDVVREDKIYNANKRADLVLNGNCADTYHPIIAVEIKCQSIYIDNANFCNLISEDINKLNSLPDGFRGVMLVGVVEPELANILAENGFQNCPFIHNAIALFYKVIDYNL